MLQKFSIPGLLLIAGLLTNCGQSGDSANATPPAAAPAPTAAAPETTPAPTPASQEPERFDMAKEGPSIVWEEKMAPHSIKSFVFYAKKGQKLSLSFIDDTNQGSMDLGKYAVEPNGDPLSMIIEVPKDYTFTVTNNSDKATSFRISLSLE